MEGEFEVGGVTGDPRGDGTYRNLVVRGAVTGDRRVGGVVGQLDGSGTSVSDLTAETTVSGTDDIGGIVGETAGGTLSNAVVRWRYPR
jgi:hypothetical protein